MAQPLGDEEELEENEGTREAQAEKGEGKGREMRRWKKREIPEKEKGYAPEASEVSNDIWV